MSSKELCYKIEIDEETGAREYYLDDKPHTFIDPKLVEVGCMVYFDRESPSKNGIVTNIREDDFVYYDVGQNDTLQIEEVAMFRVFAVDCLNKCGTVTVEPYKKPRKGKKNV